MDRLDVEGSGQQLREQQGHDGCGIGRRGVQRLTPQRVGGGVWCRCARDNGCGDFAGNVGGDSRHNGSEYRRFDAGADRVDE